MRGTGDLVVGNELVRKVLQEDRGYYEDLEGGSGYHRKHAKYMSELELRE